MKDLAKFLWGVVCFMMPPKDDPGSSPEANLWRWKTFGGVLGMYVLGALHVLWICGVLSAWGLPFGGAAWASDMVATQGALNMLLRQQAEENIQRSQLAVCRLQAAAEKPGADMYSLQIGFNAATRDLRAHLSEYEGLAKRSFTLQPCSVVLIAGGK